MLAVKSMSIRDNFKDWCDKVVMGETVVISRPKNKNVYLLSEKEYNDLQKAKRNAEYLSKLEHSFSQAEQGKTISFSIEELKEMESDNWKPTEKIMNFLEKANNE